MYDLFMDTIKETGIPRKQDMQYVFTALCARPIRARGLSAFPLSNLVFVGYSLVVYICCRLQQECSIGEQILIRSVSNQFRHFYALS